MNCCTTQVPVCVVKGTNFSLDVAFTTAYTEVINNPLEYQGQLVFREWQDDAAPVYLTLTASVDVSGPDAPAAMYFRGSPSDTLLLPDWDVVAYCNLIGLVLPSTIQRLFNVDVSVSE